MTREKAIQYWVDFREEIDQFMDEYWTKEYIAEQKEATDMAISALREQEIAKDTNVLSNCCKNGNSWISVEERLPEHGQKVLGIDSDGEIEVWCFDAEYPSMCRYGGNLRAFDISRWMPLPEPPEVEV